MNPKRRNQILISSGLILFTFFSIPGDGICVPPKISYPILRSGDLFPSLSFINFFTEEERIYLGVDKQEIVSLESIQAEVLVVNFLNTNCVYCIKSVPSFNRIFQMIEQDRTLLKRIKIIGIGVGDTRTEVDVFKEQHAIPYPIIPDTEFEAHKAVNQPTVPFIAVTRRDRQGRWAVATVHVGLTFSAESFVGELKAILEIDPNTLKKD